MTGCLASWRACDNGLLTVNEFLYCYLPRKKNDRWYLSYREGRNLIMELPSKHRGWKDRFFFVFGDGWEFSPNESLFLGGGTSIPRTWDHSHSTDFREPILGHHELEGVQKALAHSVHEFLPLVTPQALSTHHLGPEPTGESSTPRKVMSKKLKNQGSEHSSQSVSKEQALRVGDTTCSLTPTNLDLFRLYYSIPNTVKLRLPAPDERACSFSDGEICFYKCAFVAGLRFPIPLFVKQLLFHLNLAPTQFSPNAWRVITGCLALWRACGNGLLTVDEFLYCYIPKKNNDWWYFSYREGRNLITGLPSKHRGWKDRFFFVSGDGWEFSPNESLFRGGGTPIPRTWDHSHSTVSDDDEIDYSVKPEFYDPDLDEKDELWVQRKRKGRLSDAVLSCPACFTTLCLECQRHEKYVTQYRAIFVVNCKIKSDQVSQQGSLKRKRGKRGRESVESEAASAGGETFRPVCCSVCATEVGVIDEDEVYHFFNVLPSEC